jgi:histidinol dehydrogenase
MNVARYTDADYGAKLKKITAPSMLFDPGVEQRTRAIIDAVRERGDRALIEFTQQFDGAKLSPKDFAVTEKELRTASASANAALKRAVAAASKNVRDFSLKSLRKDWRFQNAQGAMVGEKFDPLARVGIYVPGGHAPLVSTVLMTVTLAKVAGCSEIVVCSPCNRAGAINPSLLYALRFAGATEIYRIGGAQAIAAMAFGTETIPAVQKVFGPGNSYVVTAKRLVYGHVGIDLLPGPSEGLVLADDSAEPQFIAADLIAQAEHGSGHERVWLVTTSAEILRAVEAEMIRQLAQSKRREAIQHSLDANGWLIHVENLDRAIALVNKLAPEHCEVMTRQPERAAKRIVTAGALFLGHHSPTAAGDYLAGPSHELPTGGAGRAFSGLTVDQFQRRTSVVKYARQALQNSADLIATLADVEGLGAHHDSISIRQTKETTRSPERRKLSRR